MVREGWKAGDIGDMTNVPDVGDTARSNIDNGDAGRSGDAIGNSAFRSNFIIFCGGMRNGLMGERGVRGRPGYWTAGRANGEGVSGAQNDSGGTGGALVMVGIEVVPGRGNVARRGVGGRGVRHTGMEMLSELGRGRAGSMAGKGTMLLRYVGVQPLQ